MYTYYLLTLIDAETEKIIYESTLLTKKTLSVLLKPFDEDNKTHIIIKEKNYSEPVWWLKEEESKERKYEI